MLGSEVMVVLREAGVLLESAQGPIPNVAEMVAGEPIRGSWWGHPAGHAIYDVLNELADSPDVVRLRLVNGKVTLVHRRVWPALVRISDRIGPARQPGPSHHRREASAIGPARLAAIEQEHTATGAHRNVELPYPSWVPSEVSEQASTVTEEQAFDLLPDCLRPAQ